MGTNTITYLDRTFDAHDVISGNAYYARPLNSASLEIDTFSFDVQSDDTSLTEFIRNTPLTFYHDGNQMGIFYVQTISRTSINTYHFTCTSTVGLLDETYHDGGIYTGETVREVCTDICKPLTCYVKSNIANIKLYGWLPIATRRENLAQVLFAIGATLKVDYNGAIRIEGLWDGQSSEITASEMYAGGSVEYATPVTEVIVTEHAYSQSTTEVTELFNGTTAAGDKITFDDPCYDLEATGFEITESGANYAIVTAGSGVLNGKKYTHVTRQIIAPTNTRSRSLVKQSNNTVKVENATLVSLVNANAVAERLAEYYSHNERINNKIAIKREIPGDVVRITHPYGGEVAGCIESADVTVSGRLAAQENVLLGYIPPNIAEQEYYDVVEVITEDCEWEPKNGVTTITVVLIGGGSGGGCGCKGEQGKQVTVSYKEESGLAYAQNTGYGLGIGGAGGAGGQGGAGGRIYQTTLKNVQGKKYVCRIGQGGEGAVYNENNILGTEGTPTLFGEFSSDHGSSSPSGFVDLVSGERYGDTGESGIAGGSGSSGIVDAVSNSTELKTFRYGEKVVDEDGESWISGGNPGEETTVSIRSKSADYSSNARDGWVSAGVSNGLTGGAAAGANGSTTGYGTYSATSSPFSGSASAHAGATGATPSKVPHIPQQLGRGGRGGYGGGGAGGHGLAIVSYRQPSNHYPSVSTSLQSLGDGGNGGKGGTGASGCILVYSHVPKPAAAFGTVQDKNGKYIFDKYGRRLIV